MAQTTAIEWTDLSWNPTHGCSKVSPGCAHCYAETLSLRYGQTPKAWTPENAAENVLLKPHKLKEPLSGAKAWQGLGAAAAAAGKTDGKLVFVNSMSDLFHEDIPDAYLMHVFTTMRQARQHTFQVLTKRPERMRDVMCRLWFSGDVACIDRSIPQRGQHIDDMAEYLPNVWLGVSIENRRFVGRAELLRATPAAVRFISAEPLLGPLVSRHIDFGSERHLDRFDCREPGCHLEALFVLGDRPMCDDHATAADLDLTGIDWLIVGGESGPGHRPMNVEWARDLRDACQARAIGDERPDTAFFMKQMGGSRPGTALEDLPADLRIREFPIAARETAVPAC